MTRQENARNPRLARPLRAAALGAALALSACSVVGMGTGPDGTRTYRVRGEETLHDVAHKFDLGFVEVAAANPDVDPWLPGKGTRVVLPTEHLPPRGAGEGIVVNLADMRLYHYEKEGERPRSYAIGIGREGLTTPLGTTTIERKMENPTWRPTARMRREDPTLPAAVGPGPLNPMGSRALYLAKRPYAIHGTNKPLGVGRRVSSGCIRMYPEDIEALYDDVEPGTKVTIVDQPVKVGWIDGELYVEAHPTAPQTEALQLGRRRKRTEGDAPPLSDDVARLVRGEAGEAIARLDWEIVRRAAAERRGYPVRVTR